MAANNGISPIVARQPTIDTACKKHGKKTEAPCTEVLATDLPSKTLDDLEAPAVPLGFINGLYDAATQALYNYLKKHDPAAFEIFRLLGDLQGCQEECERHNGLISQDGGQDLGPTVLRLLNALNFADAIIEGVGVPQRSTSPSKHAARSVTHV